jgi:heme/copper-type cytochrome/quinol oxidase subunit 4
MQGKKLTIWILSITLIIYMFWLFLDDSKTMTKRDWIEVMIAEAITQVIIQMKFKKT